MGHPEREQKQHKELKRLKLQLAKQLHLNKEPKNTDLLAMLPLQHQIITKPSRTISGVAPVAIMTAPRKCPHGTCTFCPGGPDSFFGDMAQSYTGNEPASMRAKRNFFDPFLQVMNRLEHYILLNQFPQKTELIIMGGTFLSYPPAYQEWFVTGALQAMNHFAARFLPNNVLDRASFTEFFELSANVKDPARIRRIQEKLIAYRHYSPTTLTDAQQKNETASVRCTAMVVETKPDWCTAAHINQVLRLGTTRVELGCQSTNNNVLKQTNRGHTVQHTIDATQRLKDAFLKVTYHMMLGLPGASPEIDRQSFNDMINSPEFRPDSLKIYPCRIFPGTPLYSLWKAGRFTPITTEEACERIASIKPNIPKWMRIMRIQRDIPSHISVAGPNQTNMRQHVAELMKANNQHCRCIRCREPRNRPIVWDCINITETTYEASQGTEVFIAAEDTKNNIVIGFCRLRIPHQPFRPEITKDAAGIRELHVYGQQLALRTRNKSAAQHHGLGKRLVQRAEQIAREKFDKKKMVIISGIGVREYYRKMLNYSQEGPSVVKEI